MFRCSLSQIGETLNCVSLNSLLNLIHASSNGHCSTRASEPPPHHRCKSAMGRCPGLDKLFVAEKVGRMNVLTDLVQMSPRSSVTS